MSILDWFGCRHRDRKLVKIIHYDDTSSSGYYSGYIHYQPVKDVPSTKIIWRCTRCGDLFKQAYYGFGYLTEKEINGD